MDKQAHYQKIIQAQWQRLFAFFGMPFVAMAATFVIGERYVLFLFISWAAFFAWSNFWLQAVDTCPWCGLNFVQSNNFWRLLSNTMPTPPSKHCINCGAPHQSNEAKP
jgi:hypothetical protein